jgi:hypothetical protein
MKKQICTYWHGKVSETEHRLCFGGLESGSDTPPMLSADNNDTFTEKQFFDAAPAALQEALEAKDVTGLTDISDWMNVLKNKNLFDNKTAASASSSAKSSPAEKLLLGLPAQDRRAIWLGYVDNYITRNLQHSQNTEKWNDLLKVDLANDPDSRFQAIIEDPNLPDAFSQITSALGGIFGVETLADGTESKTLALESLHTYYGLHDASWEINRNLQGDYEAATRYQHSVAGSEPGTVATMLRDLDASGILKQATPFLGALKLGALNDNALNNVRNFVNRSDQETMQVRSTVIQDTNALKQNVEESIKRDSLNVSKYWREMSGAGKLLTVAAAAGALYLVYKSFKAFPKMTALGAIVIGGSYLSYNTLSGENPIASLKKSFRRWQQGNSEAQIVGRSMAIADYLHANYDVNDLETEASALMLLSEGPLTMADLAQSYDVRNGNDTSAWNLRTEPGSVIDKKIEESYPEDAGKLRTFFADPDNKKEINEGISYLFFTIAVQDESIRNDPEVRDDIELVRLALGKMQARQGITELQGDSREAYNRLVLRGHGIALTQGGISPGDFIRNVLSGNVAQLNTGNIPPKSPGNRAGLPPNSPASGASNPTVSPGGGNDPAVAPLNGSNNPGESPATGDGNPVSSPDSGNGGAPGSPAGGGGNPSSSPAGGGGNPPVA